MMRSVKRTPLLMTNEWYVREAVKEACEIWQDYRDVFEHSGDICTNPMLTDGGKFGAFCKEWAVARTIRAGLQDQFRCTLRDSPDFAFALDDASGRTLDRLHHTVLRPAFGTRDGKRALISVVSKIATFLRPQNFTPWDRYACLGLNLVIGRKKSVWFDSYADYLARFEEAWGGEHGERIRALTESTAEQLQNGARFQKRVLDLYLMRQGGYQQKSAVVHC